MFQTVLAVVLLVPIGVMAWLFVGVELQLRAEEKLVSHRTKACAPDIGNKALRIGEFRLEPIQLALNDHPVHSHFFHLK